MLSSGVFLKKTPHGNMMETPQELENRRKIVRVAATRVAPITWECDDGHISKLTNGRRFAPSQERCNWKTYL